MSSMDGGQDETPCRPQSKGSKQIKCERLASIASPSTVGKAPTSRVYTNDYSKVQPEKGDRDIVGPYLGNPLRW